MKTEYFWNDEAGLAECHIHYKKYTFCGIALCHPEDEDMKSRLTGEKIAEARATAAYLKHVRDHELRPQLKALMDYYHTMYKNAAFSEISYENKILQRKIHFLEDDLETINKTIVLVNKNLTDFLSQKEKLYQKIRSKRLGKKGQTIKDKKQ